MVPEFRTLRTSPSDAYRLYRSISLHFSSPSYDCFKFRFKLKPAEPKPNMRHLFEKWARWFPNQYELVEFLVFNIVTSEGQKLWPGDFSREVVDARRGYIESYSYKLKSEIQAMKGAARSFDELFLVQPSSMPILTLISERKVSYETAALINNAVGFCVNSTQLEALDPFMVLRPQLAFIRKYQPFVIQVIDFNKVRATLISEFTPGKE